MINLNLNLSIALEPFYNFSLLITTTFSDTAP